MKRPNKKKVKKAAASKGKDTSAPQTENLIGIQFTSTGCRGMLDIIGFVRFLMKITDSNVFYDFLCDLSNGKTAKEMDRLGATVLSKFIGLETKSVSGQQGIQGQLKIYIGHLYFSSNRSFEAIKQEVDRVWDDVWSICPRDTPHQVFGFLPGKHPGFIYHTDENDYARRIQHHLLDRTGKIYKIDCKSIEYGDVVKLGLATNIIFTREVELELRHHPVPSLKIAFFADMPNQALTNELKQNYKMLAAYIGIRVWGLANRDVERLRSLLQIMEGHPKDLDQSFFSGRGGEYLILSHPHCKDSVVQKVNGFLQEDDTINRHAFPELFPQGPVLDEGHFELFGPDTFRKLCQHCYRVRQFERCNGDKFTMEKLAREAIVSSLVAMKCHPNNASIQRYASLTINDVFQKVDSAADFVANGGLEAVVSVMQKQRRDRILLCALMKIVELAGGSLAWRAFEDTGATNELLSAMKYHKKIHSIQEEGLSALVSWYYKDPPKDEKDVMSTLSLEIVDSCLAAMESIPCNQTLQMYGCMLLDSMMKNHSDAVMGIVQSGGFETISSAGTKGGTASPATLKHCCMALRHFLDLPPLRQRCFEFVTEVMKSNTSCPVVQEGACVFLCGAAEEQNNTVLFQQCGTIQFLLVVLSTHTYNATVQKFGNLTLYSLIHSMGWEALGDGNTTLPVCGLHYVEQMSQDTLCRWNGIRALHSLITSSSLDDWLAHPRKVGNIIAIAAMMISNCNETALLKLCLEILAKISSWSNLSMRTAAAKLPGVGASIVGAMLANEYDERLQQLSCQVLWVITDTEDSAVLEQCSETDAIGGILAALIRFPRNKTILNLGGATAFRVRGFEHRVQGQVDDH